MREAIDNQAVRTFLAEHEPGLGLVHPSSEPGFSCYVQGVGGTGAGNSVAAALNAFSHILGACLGEAPVTSTGSTATGTPTATSVTETDDGNHAANSIVPFQGNSGSVYPRPIAGYSTGAMTLLMALPAGDLPTASDVIYGAVNVAMDEDVSHVIQGEFLGRNSAQSFEYYGAVGNFSLPEAGPGEAQTCSVSLKIADYASGVATSQTSPANSRPTVAAGGEFLIAKFGETATKNLSVLNASLELGRTYEADPDPNSDMGLCGWIVTDQQTRLTLHVKDADTPPSEFTGTTYRALWGSGGDENDFHVLLNFGRKTAGKLFSVYIRRCHLVQEPELVDLGGIMCQRLVFGLSQELSAEDGIWVAQA